MYLYQSRTSRLSLQPNAKNRCVAAPEKRLSVPSTWLRAAAVRHAAAPGRRRAFLVAEYAPYYLRWLVARGLLPRTGYALCCLQRGSTFSIARPAFAVCRLYPLAAAVAHRLSTGKATRILA